MSNNVGATTQEELLGWVRSRKWFYRFELPDGGHTEVDVGQDILDLHEARLNSLLASLTNRYGDKLAEMTCLDIASHEGYFALALARRMKHVVGIDTNEASIVAARNMARLQGIPNVEFRQGNANALSGLGLAPADVVIIFGLIYHTEDPITVLRRAFEHCRSAMFIETQLTNLELSGPVEWGSFRWQMEIQGIFYLVEDVFSREGGTTGMALVPSVRAVTYTLSRLGFEEVVRLDIGHPWQEQFARGSRGIIAGFKRAGDLHRDR